MNNKVLQSYFSSILKQFIMENSATISVIKYFYEEINLWPSFDRL
jgi:hypothetical protein